MGNTNSSPSSGILRKNPVGPAIISVEDDLPQSLAMMAVARRIFLKKVHVMMLRYSMAKLSDDFGMIQREGFEKALVRANLVNFDIFNLLYILWHNENEKVPYREFCVGLSPLACPWDDLSTILEFALRVSDDDPNRKHIEKMEVHEILTGINATASHFGDAHLRPIEIDGIVDAIFDKEEVITHEECIKLLSRNPYVKRFASGKARSTVRFRDVLETNYIFDKEKLVTEYIVDDIDSLLTHNLESRDDVDTTEKEGMEPILEIGESSFTSLRDEDYDDGRDEGHHASNSIRSASTTSSRDEGDTATTTKTAMAEGHYSFSPKKKSVPSSPFSDDDFCDENSGIRGNAIESRDPPPSSYSTYQNTFRSSQSTTSSSRDPPPMTTSSPLHYR